MLQEEQVYETMLLIPREHNSDFSGPLEQDTARTSILIAMLTVAIYMSFLVDLKVLTIFQRRNTLYFWSLLVTSWGIISHSLGVILKWFVGRCPWEVHTTFSSLGWWAMVTGQSLVLYSRLHLVVRDERILRAVLIMIIVDFGLFQVPTTVQKFGSTQRDPGVWLTVYHVYERIQLLVFTFQELIISSIYIRAAVKWLSPSEPEGMRHTKQYLIYLNILCIALDIAIICEVYSGEWVYEEATQSLSYAIKLTLEFAVLNQVMEVYRRGPSSCQACHHRFAPNSLHSLPERGVGHSNRQHRSSTEQGSSAPRCLSNSWPRNKPIGCERLGSFDEAMIGDPSAADVVTEVQAGLTPASIKLQGKDAGRNIVVTHGITTCIEERASGSYVRPME
ncbi:MAG: hypothetical protein Q9163_002417 [Psora crenata]